MYCTITDIVTHRIRLQDLLPYVDDDGMARLVSDIADIPDDCRDRLERAIAMVSSDIDDVLRGQYPVPLASPIPDRVKLIAIDMVLAELAKRRPGEIPETISSAYKDAVRRLNEIRDRRVKLYDAAPATGGDPLVTDSYQSSVFGGFIP